MNKKETVAGKILELQRVLSSIICEIKDQFTEEVKVAVVVRNHKYSTRDVWIGDASVADVEEVAKNLSEQHLNCPGQGGDPINGTL